MKEILIEKSWLELLKDQFQKNYMEDLKNFLKEEIASGHTIYPDLKLIFNAFFQTPFNNVKAVIVGQDPYHGPMQAHGLSFSVREGIAIPPSLRNIFKELKDDLGIDPPKSGSLIPWAKEGVLLLNATLTVRKHLPRSHYGKGWEIFTDRVLEVLAERRDSIVFLLWGRSAKEKCIKVLERFKNKNHLILTAAHPSFYSAANFFGCKHFSKTNNFLKSVNKKPIDWKKVCC